MQKRIFDIVVSTFGLILLTPLMIVISVLIAIFMGNSVIFTQIRIGRKGRPFKMYKFRSMINSSAGQHITTSDDIRITAFGRILRKYKLDELPELWNVIIGDMSIVGPRPDVPGYADKLVGEDRKILELKPGITGPASLTYANEEKILANVEDPIRFNNEEIFPDKVKINLEYYYSQSIWGDIKIILATIFRRY